MTDVESAIDRRIFLSFAYEDHELAHRISGALVQSGLHVTNQVLEDAPGGDLMELLKATVSTSDVVVVLLSPAAAVSRWINTEIEYPISRELHRRGVDLIPVLAAPIDLPSTLRKRAAVDLTMNVNAGLRQLVQQIHATSRSDFSAMSPRAFEELVADLLRAIGFSSDQTRDRSNADVDMRMTYRRHDPFGSPETEVWLIQTKLYAGQRVSIDAIRQLAGIVAVTPGVSRGLFVTNAQPTSVALEYVAELNRGFRITLRVLDGVDLRRLLRQFPAVAERHFSGGTPELRFGPDVDA